MYHVGFGAEPTAAPTPWVPKTEQETVRNMLTGIGGVALTMGLATTDKLINYGLDKAFSTKTKTPTTTTGSVPYADMLAVIAAQQASLQQHTAVPTGPTGLPALPAQPQPVQQQQMVPFSTMLPPAPEVKKGFPTWAWAVVGIGGVAAVGGALWFFLGRKK